MVILCCQMTKFSDWLVGQLHTRDISPAQLSRLMHKKDQGVVSRLLRGERNPSTETIDAIARALKLPAEEVYRAAGILPAAQTDTWLEKQNYKLSLITDPTLRETAERLINSLAEQEEAAAKSQLKHKRVAK